MSRRFGIIKVKKLWWVLDQKNEEMVIGFKTMKQAHEQACEWNAEEPMLTLVLVNEFALKTPARGALRLAVA